MMGRIDLFPLTGRAEAGAILATRVAGHDAAFGLTMLQAAAGELRVPRLDLPVGAALRVRIRARDVMIALAPPEGLSALNVLPGIVAEIGGADGPIVEMRLDCAGEALVARLTRRSVETLGLVTGPPGLRGHQEHRLRPPRLCRRRSVIARRRCGDPRWLTRNASVATDSNACCAGGPKAG